MTIATVGASDTSPTLPAAAVRDFLTTLEEDEARLLSWGVVDGAFTHGEVEARATFFLEQRELSEVAPCDLINALLNRGLLVDLPWRGQRVLRTRMAETVRLLARVRQWFSGDWRNAPALVSDFRFTLRRRVYPGRDLENGGVSIEAAFGAWREAGVLSPGHERALRVLLGRPGMTGLAGFQVRATTRLLANLGGSVSRGTIVTVGTGSGKTLAFYLPVLTAIAADITARTSQSRRPSFATYALALYPRNELLKDQFSETYREARRLDAVRDSGRKLLIGAFFGPTPLSASEDHVRSAEGWTRTAARDGYVCPYLRCPHDGCGGDLVWAIRDMRSGCERLTCATCRTRVEQDEIVLTRQRMQQTPPDVLFATTEMLNRVMANQYSRHVFGLSAEQPPRVVLLDEVHTYVGTQGAQVALLLRRWQHALGWPVQFVGLSATLRNAADFLADLTGLARNEVEEVTPTAEEMTVEGMEYLLALRGDPVAQTALLSTTIQTVMLLRRALDPAPRPGQSRAISEGAYGRRVFVFTDDLDVTNRLYHNLLDAEARDGRGRARPGRTPLAALRTRAAADGPARMLAGQSWYLAEEIGHPAGLAQGLLVGRTSSQDVGVERDADVVIATASLEVGYNDPDVGAVVQHKAPRDVAAFLQRKGRAGRVRTMRPWTVVVLSDFGRDRLAFQGYDNLFDPVLVPRALPIANRYVLRMQAVFAFMDWMGAQFVDAPPGSVYQDFAEPAPAAGGSGARRRERQRREAGLVQRLLDGDESLLEDLERYLQSALRVSREETLALLWEPPRALMLHVLPTIHRRLVTGWRRLPLGRGDAAQDYLVRNSPLPDFAPSNLFSDLNLPEVVVYSTSGGEEREDALPILQAMSALAPGKVTRRFAVRDPIGSHWIPIRDLAPSATRQRTAVEDICAEFEEVGDFERWGPTLSGGHPTGMALVPVRCIRPRVLRPERAPARLSPSSNARLRWSSQLLPVGDGLLLELPTHSQWRAVIASVRLYSHVYQSYVEARRFASGVTAELRFRRTGGTGGSAARAPQPPLRTEVDFIGRDGNAAALGFRAYVDGLCFRLHRPRRALVSGDDANGAKLRAFRIAYFRHRIHADAALRQLDFFQREWLCHVFLSALTAWAVAEQIPLRDANEALRPVLPQAARRVLDVIFETLATPAATSAPGPDDDEEEDDMAPVAAAHESSLAGTAAAGLPPTAAADSAHQGTAGSRRQSLRDEVLGLFARADLTDRIQTLASVLWEVPDAEWEAWAWQRYRATLGGAILEACRRLYPEAAGEDLVVDIDPGPAIATDRGQPYSPAVRSASCAEDSGHGVADGAEPDAAPRDIVLRDTEVWITESVIGGGGVIEEIGRRYREDPRRFFRLVQSALGANEYETTDVELTRLVALLVADAEVAGAASVVRTAAGYDQLQASIRDLETLLASRGVLVTRALMTAVHARILRPGSTSETDGLLHRLVRQWITEEERIGIEIDARVLAYLASDDAEVGAARALASVDPVSATQRGFRFHALYSLLWPRGSVIRSRTIATYNPFADLPEPDRELVLDTVPQGAPPVLLGSADWRARIVGMLQADGMAVLTAPVSAAHALRAAVVALAAEPIDIDFLLLYPSVVAAERRADRLQVTLHLADLPQ